MLTLQPSIFSALAACTLVAHAGPFAPAAGVPGSDAIAAADARFTLWATAAEITRGPSNIASANPILVTYGTSEDAIGPADTTPDEPYAAVSLGDGGNAVLTFATPFADLPGPDFVVFENSFNASFLELGHVEVSSDGIHFFRFPSTSLTPANINLGNGGAVDPTDVRNLAGKYIAGFGTPFDLAEMRRFSPQLDVQRITHVRVIDVVGTNVIALGSFDAAGAIIIDPYPTNFFSGGFDLDAVGAFSATTTTFPAWLAAHGYVGNSALPDADPDQNGMPNLIEYLTGGARISVTRVSGNTKLRFPRLAYRAGADLHLESSVDLVVWNPLAQSINGGTLISNTTAAVVVESGDFLKETGVTISSSQATRFFRLSAKLTASP